MRPTYTKHARFRMTQRNISEDDVEDTLAHYHTHYTDRKGNPIYIAHVKGRRIKVVVSAGSNPPHVITVGD